MAATRERSSGSTLADAMVVRVYYEDTDAAGIVYYANYLKFAERARTELLRRAGMSHPQLLQDHDVAFVVRHCGIDYLAPARLDDELTVLTRVADVRCASLMMSQEISRHDTLLVRLSVRLAAVNAAGRAVRMPPALRDRLVAKAAEPRRLMERI